MAREPGRAPKPDRRRRLRKDGDCGFNAALKFVWRTTKYMCSRHFNAAMPEWLRPIQEEYGRYLESINERLLCISARSICRILKPYKALKGKSFTGTAGFREEISI